MTTAVGYGWQTSHTHIHQLPNAWPAKRQYSYDKLCKKAGWMMGVDGASLGEVFKDVLSVNAHDTAAPLLRHAPTHLESAHGRLLSFGCRGVRRANTRPKASISSQSDSRRGGPVATFSHLVSLCARKTAPSTTNAAVLVLCLFGRGCGWKDGGGKGWRETPRGKKIGYEKRGFAKRLRGARSNMRDWLNGALCVVIAGRQ